MVSINDRGIMCPLIVVRDRMERDARAIMAVMGILVTISKLDREQLFQDDDSGNRTEKVKRHQEASRNLDLAFMHRDDGRKHTSNRPVSKDACFFASGQIFCDMSDSVADELYHLLYSTTERRLRAG